MSMEVFASFTNWCPDARTTADLTAVGDDTPMVEISQSAWQELGEIVVALTPLLPHEQRAAFTASFGELFDPGHVRMDLLLPGEDEADGDAGVSEVAGELGDERDCEVIAIFSPDSCKRIAALMTNQDLESYGEILGANWSPDWMQFDSAEDVLEVLDSIYGCFAEAAEGELGLMFCAL